MPEIAESYRHLKLFKGFVVVPHCNDCVWRKRLPVKTALLPPVDVQVLSDDGKHKVILNDERVKCEVFSDGKDSIPHYIDFPIKDRETYLPFKPLKRPSVVRPDGGPTLEGVDIFRRMIGGAAGRTSRATRG